MTSFTPVHPCSGTQKSNIPFLNTLHRRLLPMATTTVALAVLKPIPTALVSLISTVAFCSSQTVCASSCNADSDFGSEYKCITYTNRKPNRNTCVPWHCQSDQPAVQKMCCRCPCVSRHVYTPRVQAHYWWSVVSKQSTRREVNCSHLRTKFKKPVSEG